MTGGQDKAGYESAGSGKKRESLQPTRAQVTQGSELIMTVRRSRGDTHFSFCDLGYQFSQYI